MTIDQTIEKLKSSPLFYLFVSSRELFHSNFWYWLYTLNPIEAGKLFGLNLKEGDKVAFHREFNVTAYRPPKKGNVRIVRLPDPNRARKKQVKADLAIFVNDDLKMIVENKVKDFASHEQLHKIKKSFVTDVKLLLVTLFHNNEITYDGWEVLKYSELQTRISCDKFTDNEYYSKLISDYKELIANLVSLTIHLPVTDKYDFIIHKNGALYNLLDKIIWDGYQKMRGYHLLQSITNYDNGLEVHPIVALNNRKATIHFPIVLDLGYRIGIQMEDTQFRRFVSGPDPLTFAQNLNKSGLFLDKTKAGPKSSKLFGKYNPDFRYQYTKLEKGTPYYVINEMIKKEFEYIKNNMEEIRKNIPKAK